MMVGISTQTTLCVVIPLPHFPLLLMPVPCAPSHLECSSDVHRILCMHAVLSVLSVEENTD